MKIIYLLIFLFSFLTSNVYAQAKPDLNNSKPTAYWKDKTSMFGILPNTKDEIIFLGDSITDRCEWNELFSSIKIKNRGLSGDETAGVLDRLDEVLESKPKQIFLMIGVNDLRHGIPTETIIKNYKEIVKKIIKVSPSTELIIQSVLPVNNKIKDAKTNNETVIRLNNEIKKISNKNNLLYVDLFKRLIDQEGNLRKEYSSDGLHINGEAYLIWKEAIKGYVKI